MLQTDEYSDYYQREPAGTQAERDAAALQQSREDMRVPKLAARLTLLNHAEYAGEYPTEWQHALALAASDEEAKAYLEDGNTWHRTNAFTVTLGAAMGMPDDVMDSRFTEATALDASISEQ